MVKNLNKNLIVLQLFLFVIFFIWNYWQPLTADDYGYSMSNLIHNNQLFSTLYTRYFHWDGRIIADILAYAFLNQNTLNYILPIINIMNALILIAVLNIIYKFIYGQTYNLFNFLLVSGFYIIFGVLTKTFAEIFLWKTVAIQYAWGFLLVLSIIWKFYLDLNLHNKTSKLMLSLYAIAGVFIGLYSEIYVAFIFDIYISTIIIWFIFNKQWHQLLKSQYIVFLIATLFAGLILIIAPGNYIHRGYYLADIHITSSSYNILQKILMTYVQFFRYGYHVAIGVVLLYIGIFLWQKRSKIKSHDFRTLIFLLILLNLNILSFVEVAYYSPISGRMLIFIDSLIFIIIYKFIILYIDINKIQISKLNILKNLFCCLFIISFILISISYYNLHSFIRLRQDFINKNPSNALLPNYNPNFVFKYITYFDTIRTQDKDFKNLYLENRIN